MELYQRTEAKRSQTPVEIRNQLDCFVQMPLPLLQELCCNLTSTTDHSYRVIRAGSRTSTCIKKLPHHLHVSSPLIDMAEMGSPFESNPLDLAANLGGKRPHGYVLGLVLGPINQQGRHTDLMQVRNHRPVAETTRNEQLTRAVPCPRKMEMSANTY